MNQKLKWILAAGVLSTSIWCSDWPEKDWVSEISKKTSDDIVTLLDQWRYDSTDDYQLDEEFLRERDAYKEFNLNIYDFEFYQVSNWDWFYKILRQFGISRSDEREVQRFLNTNGLYLNEWHLYFQRSNNLVLPWDVLYYNSSFNWYFYDYFDKDINIDMYNRHYEKESQIEINQDYVEAFKNAIDNTVKYSSNPINPIYFDDEVYQKKLENKLNETLDTIKWLDSLYHVREYIVNEIDALTNTIDYSVWYDDDISKLFDNLATLHRINVSRDYFSSLSWEEFLEISKERSINDLISWLRVKQIHSFNEVWFQNYLELNDYITNAIYTRRSEIEQYIDIWEFIQLFNWMIMLESKFQTYNISHTWVIWITQTTKNIYMWRDATNWDDRFNYIFDKTTNPFNPKENIERGLDYVLFLYSEFENYNSDQYDINDIVFTAYNRWQGRVWRLLQNHWTNWKQFLNDTEWEQYYWKILDLSEQISSYSMFQNLSLK